MVGAKLWKMILNQGIDQDSGLAYEGKGPDAIASEIITAPIIVNNFYNDTTSLKKWSDVSGVSVPFDKFWIEGSVLGQFDDGEPQLVLGGGLVIFQKETRGIGMFSVMCRGGGCAPELLAFVSATLNEKWGFNVESDGKFRPELLIPSKNLLSLPRDDIGSTACWSLAWACDLLMVLGCKNTGLKPNDNEPKQVRRAVKRHGGKPEDYRYHTLVVRPPGAKAGTPGQDIGIMPRHVCRGHFSEYGPEFGKELLFGKLAGRFYIPPHLKGKKENGTVEKDYRIDPPKPPEVA